MVVKGMRTGVFRMIPLTIIPLTSLLPCPSKIFAANEHKQHSDKDLCCYFFAIFAFSCGQFVFFGCVWPRWAFCVSLRPNLPCHRIWKSVSICVNRWFLRVSVAAGRPVFFQMKNDQFSISNFQSRLAALFASLRLCVKPLLLSAPPLRSPADKTILIILTNLSKCDTVCRMRINQPDRSPPAWRGEREIGKSLTLKPKQVKTNQTQSNLIQPMNPTLPPPRPAPGGPPPTVCSGPTSQFLPAAQAQFVFVFHSSLFLLCLAMPASNPVKPSQSTKGGLTSIPE